MKLPIGLFLLVLLPSYGAASRRPTKRDHSFYDYYVLEHDTGASATLEEVLDGLRLELVEQVGELANTWLLRRPRQDCNDEDCLGYKGHPVSSLKARAETRDPFLAADRRHARRLAGSIRHFSPQHLRQRVKRDDRNLRAPPPIPPPSGNDSSSVVASRLGIKDPEFGDQWHLVNDEFSQNMMNTTPAWDLGITGEGVVAAIIDDGLDYDHPDLKDNFDAEGSYDYNDHEDLPTPKLFDDHHGTRCAGQIGAVMNDVCGLGIAYKSKVAGIRILSGLISDVDEAASLNYGYQKTSIYSCSWGPTDDGRSMEGPTYLIQKSVLNGIQNGRDGKGSIFVFASGNGASQGDQCNFDGYTNSIYSVTVAALDYKNLHPYYSEACAANLVVAYSSGGGQHIVTTDVGATEAKCAHNHGGTSAAAPNAVGVFALALSVRPDLTWRDVQHLCVRTAKEINPDDRDWENTAFGRKFSYKYGYGRIDAAAYVEAAKKWELVKPQAWIDYPAIQLQNGTMTETGAMSGGEPIVPGGVRSSATITQQLLNENNFESLEHVTVTVWISHTRRGDVEVSITSPNGIKSILAARRKFDDDKDGFPAWKFMSLKHWDENPVGDWTILVSDQSSDEESGHFLGWTMTLWGASADASKATPYVLVDTTEAPFPIPPPEDDTPTTTSIDTATLTSSRRPKPTEALPGDHGTAEGEGEKPAFSDIEESTSSPTATPEETFTPDEGWFSDLSGLVYDQVWVFGAIAVVVLFGLLAGIFFCVRRARQRRQQRGMYSTVTADDMAMGNVTRDGRGGRTKELYDAFGEVSDDEDADEQTRLRGSPDHGVGSSVGLGYHSAFLDDDEHPQTAGTPAYQDEPRRTSATHLPEHESAPLHEDRAKSPGSGSGSATESWDHASDIR